MSDFRMPNINTVFLAGRLTADPELRYIPSGAAVCKLRLAVSRKYKTKEGEPKEDTLFINVDVWEKLAEFCHDNLRKGRPVYVEGFLKSDTWEDRNTGQTRTQINLRGIRIQTLDWEDRGGPRPPQPEAGSEPEPETGADEEPASEDDIPF